MVRRYARDTKKKKVVEVVKKKVVEVVKRKVTGVRCFISYTGRATHLSLSGVGKIIPGKEYEVRKEVADFLDNTKNWKVRRESVFEE